MSIELIYGFIEGSDSIHINEEELLVEYGINLYALEISGGFASKACYGIPLILRSDLKTAPEIDLNSTCTELQLPTLIELLRSEDIECIKKLYNKFIKFHNEIKNTKLGIYYVYSTPLQFISKGYSLSDINQPTDQTPAQLDILNQPLEDLYKQAQEHIEEQVASQKRVMEYLQSIQENSQYKFELTHNLPAKDFLENGKITVKFEIKIYELLELIYHVKIRANGLYELAEGFNSSIDQIIIITNNGFEANEDFIGEFESWTYLFNDGSMFAELSQPLNDYFQTLVKE